MYPAGSQKALPCVQRNEQWARVCSSVTLTSDLALSVDRLVYPSIRFKRFTEALVKRENEREALGSCPCTVKQSVVSQCFYCSRRTNRGGGTTTKHGQPEEGGGGGIKKTHPAPPKSRSGRVHEEKFREKCTD